MKKLFAICLVSMLYLSARGQGIMPAPKRASIKTVLDTNLILYNEQNEPLRFYQYSKLMNSGEYTMWSNGPIGKPGTKSLLKKLSAQDKVRMYESMKPQIAIKSPELQEGIWLNIKPLLEAANEKDMDGKAIVLVFWYTECPPCTESFATINDIFKEITDQNDVIVLAVTNDNKRVAEAKLKEQPLLYARLLSNAVDITNAYQLKSYPSYVVADKNHVIRFAVTGISPVTIPAFKNAIKSVLVQ